MEDLTIIRIKRALESAPLASINLTSKKLKLDSGRSLPVIATLKSKDENLEAVLQNVVAKYKQEKQANKLTSLSSGHQELYKQKDTASKKSLAKQTDKKASAFQRYQIVNKFRGITTLDAEVENYLLKTDRLSLNLPSVAKDASKTGSSVGSDASNTAADDSVLPRAPAEGARVIPLQFLDVDHCSVKEINKNQDDTICMNGVPLEQTYVYDIFITRVPKGYSAEEFLIGDACQDPLMDDSSTDDDLGNESDDSNAENNYRNDYPDVEESDMDDSEREESEYELSDQEGITGTSQYWGDSVVDRLAHCSLGSDDDAEEKNGIFLSDKPHSSQQQSALRLSKAISRRMKEKDSDESGSEKDSDECSDTDYDDEY